MAFGAKEFRGHFQGPFAGAYGEDGQVGPPPEPEPTLYKNPQYEGAVGDPDPLVAPDEHAFPAGNFDEEFTVHDLGNGFNRIEFTITGGSNRTLIAYGMSNNDNELEVGETYRFSVNTRRYSDSLNTGAHLLVPNAAVGWDPDWDQTTTETSRNRDLNVTARVYIDFVVTDTNLSGGFRFGNSTTNSGTGNQSHVDYWYPRLEKVEPEGEPPNWNTDLPDATHTDRDLPQVLTMDTYCDGADTYQLIPPTSDAWELQGRDFVVIDNPVDLGDHQLRVEAENAEGTSESNTATWEIIGTAPDIDTQPTDTTVDEGDDALFTIELSHPNTDTFFYQWQAHDGDIWVNADVVFPGRLPLGSGGDTLIIRPAEPGDTATEIRCRTRSYEQNEAYSVYSDEVTLTVEEILEGPLFTLGVEQSDSASEVYGYDSGIFTEHGTIDPEGVYTRVAFARNSRDIYVHAPDDDTAGADLGMQLPGLPPIVIPPVAYNEGTRWNIDNDDDPNVDLYIDYILAAEGTDVQIVLVPDTDVAPVWIRDIESQRRGTGALIRIPLDEYCLGSMAYTNTGGHGSINGRYWELGSWVGPGDWSCQVLASNERGSAQSNLAIITLDDDLYDVFCENRIGDDGTSHGVVQDFDNEG